MSKKDILDRLSTNGGSRTVVRKRAAADTPATPGSTQSTRVRAGVIRRRRKAKDAAAPPDLPNVVQEVAAPAEEAKPVEESVEAAAVQEEATPAAEAVEEITAESSETDNSGSEETAAVETAAVEAADQPVPESTSTSEEQSTEKVEASGEQAASEEAPVAEKPVEKEAAPAPEEAKPSAGAGLPRLPGLGSAVVRPPPGYDPSNPAASIEANKAETRKPQTQEDRWSSNKTGADTGRSGEQDKKERGRPRQDARRGRRRQAYGSDDFYTPQPLQRRRRNRRSGPKKESPQPKAQKRRIQIDHTVSVKQLAQEMGVRAAQVLKTLIGMGSMVTINDQIDFDTAQLVAAEFEYEVINIGFAEVDHLIKVEEDQEAGDPRAAVVTIMGHVDHGKTTLLDSIRNASVADGEAGGITQHIGAYQAERNGEVITFIDTPGHQAFTEMRARGAQVTDIVIIVVAADDGIMPQTVESINHAKAAGVPIIVAVNKCDKPGVNPDTVRQRLMEHELVPEEYGGDTMMVNVSALKGQGLDELLDAILLVAEVHEYKAVKDRHAEGVVLEARLEKGRGAVATLLVKHGTLGKGNSVVLGTTHGRIRAMTDYSGKTLKEAGPSMPVEVIGLSQVPVAGDNFVVVKSDKDAKALVENRLAEQKAKAQVKPTKVTLEDLFSMAEQGAASIKDLNLIVKADVQGSIEALKGSLEKIEVDGIVVKVLHSGVGGITESDITLAAAYGAIVIGFNVRPDGGARRAADAQGVQCRYYKVIYEALDEIAAAAKGLLEPTIEEQHRASIQVRKVFTVPKVGAIAGCMVIDGKVARGQKTRLLRDSVIIWEGSLSSLKRFKDDVKEVDKGYECGIGLENYNDIKEGDIIEAYELVEIRG
ncbi:MAG: translation initiation factor IF-2 [Myxococcota bacterium]|nr:translation initiation factor IF-2 [Myxococcota bacterium]